MWYLSTSKRATERKKQNERRKHNLPIQFSLSRACCLRDRQIAGHRAIISMSFICDGGEEILWPSRCPP